MKKLLLFLFLTLPFSQTFAQIKVTPRSSGTFTYNFTNAPDDSVLIETAGSVITLDGQAYIVASRAVYDSLAIAETAADVANIGLMIFSAFTVTSNHTFDVPVKFVGNGKITHTSFTLTFNDFDIEANPNAQVFDGTGDITYTNRATHPGWFGVIGNDGLDDEPKFEEAMQNSNGLVICQPYTYNFNDEPAMPDSIEVVGVYGRTIFTYVDSATTNLFGAGSSVEWALIRNIIFEGPNAKSTTTSALVRSSGQDVTFERCVFRNYRRTKLAIQVSQAVNYARRNVVTRCHFHQGDIGDNNVVQATGVLGTSKSIYFEFSKNFVWDSSGAAGVEIDNSVREAIISENWFFTNSSDSATASAIESDDASGNIIITNNHIFGDNYGWYAGILAQRGDSANVITGNIITGVFRGIELTVDANNVNAQQTVIADNILKSLGGSGIIITSAVSGLPRWLNIHDNEIINFGLDDPSATTTGIKIQADQSLIHSNIVTSTGATSDSAYFGITMTEGTKNKISNNFVDGMKSNNDYTFVADNDYWNNTGHVAGATVDIQNRMTLNNANTILAIMDGPIKRDSLMTKGFSRTIADDDTLLLPTGVQGWGYAMIGNNTEASPFEFTTAGIPTLGGDASTNTVTTFTDAKFCIKDVGSGVGLINRLGSTLRVSYMIYYW